MLSYTVASYFKGGRYNYGRTYYPLRERLLNGVNRGVSNCLLKKGADINNIRYFDCYKNKRIIF